MKKFCGCLVLFLFGCGGAGPEQVKVRGDNQGGEAPAKCKATRPSHFIDFTFEFTGRQNPKIMQVRYGMGKNAPLHTVYNECLERVDTRFEYTAKVSRLGNNKVYMKSEFPFEKKLPDYFEYEILEVEDCESNRVKSLIDGRVKLKVKEKSTGQNCPKRKVAQHKDSYP